MISISGTTFEWKNYSDRFEVEENGITAGEGLYVGGGTHSSGESGPTMLAFDYGGCFFSFAGKSVVLSGCVYLVNQPGNFAWIKSKNGEFVKGAVEYRGVPVGRVRHRGKVMRIGKISRDEGHKCIYYAYADEEYKAKSYEVLVFKPHRS